PMLTDDFGREKLSAFTMQHFWQCLGNGRTLVRGAGGATLTEPVSGVLWGGNLAMLTHLIGTPYLPKIVGGILFLEDINEHPFRIERMLLQLLYAGVLAQQSAIVLGDFSGGRLVDFDNGYSMDSVVTLLRSRLEVPIVTGLQFGHIADKVTLPVGANASLRSSDGGWELEISGYPVLNRPLPPGQAKGADTGVV
ncbi:MAG: muramoyltetrapeptide carboxypeptidase, partial [Pseudomonadota bacterium]|nr:muramoyltetrapeptide carboxypeptidase [Pseudomonadota bacterium]